MASGVIPERCPPAQHLYIAVPAYDGKTAINTTLSLAGAGVALALCGFEVTFASEPGCAYLDHARNVLATKFMRSNATDLLFVDADVAAPPEAYVQIARATRPFICGLYPQKCDEISFPVRFDVDRIWSDAEGYVSPCTVPTGFLRISRAVFEAMPCTMYEDDKGDEWMGYFHSGVRYGKYSGEDTRFCREWQAIGGKIHMIPDITFQHAGMKVWEGNWGRWLKAQA